MKIRKTKKGFTIVELVIVIAVIGVLTAILVPTFISLTAKANKASDQSLVANLNTALKMQEAEDGAKNPTMHDAVLDLAEQGFDLGKLVTKSNQDLLWNSKTNQFELAKEQEGAEYWKIYDSAAKAEAEHKFSVYAKEGFGTSVTLNGLGFDAGSVTNIATVTYKNTSAGKEVVIRTNGGTLTIDAPTDTVHHYDAVEKVVIEHINTSSYHEYGKVLVSMTVNNGHAVVESKGFVNELVIPSSATSASVDVKKQATVSTAIVDSATTPVTIEQDAEVSQFVGDTTSVSGAGASSVTQNAVTKEEVATPEELKAAVLAGKKYVSITADMTLTSWSSEDSVGVAVTKDLILDGNGHTLTINTGRGIWIDDNNVALTVKNMKMVGASAAFQRAIQVCGDMKGAKLIIENFEVTNASYYAINICNNSDVDLQITNSKITGWGALNLWSANYKVYVSGSELIGINDKTYNAEGWNDFGTVILEGDTTLQTTSHASTIDVAIVNTIIRAQTTKNNKQWCVLFNSQCTSNNVTLDGCTLDYNESENTYKYLDLGEGNNLYVDGVKIN